MNDLKHNISHAPSEETFQPSNVPDEITAEASPGGHQRLVRLPDGRHLLIVRLASGIVRRIPVLAFESGVIL